MTQAALRSHGFNDDIDSKLTTQLMSRKATKLLSHKLSSLAYSVLLYTFCVANDVKLK